MILRLMVQLYPMMLSKFTKCEFACCTMILKVCLSGLQADGRLTMMKVSYEDTSIFQQPCDIFAPCAKFKVKT